MAPALSTKKPAPQGSKRTARTPKAMEALCLYDEPSSRTSNHPSLKGYTCPPSPLIFVFGMRRTWIGRGGSEISDSLMFLQK